MSVHWSILRGCVRSAFRTLIVDDRQVWRGVDILGAAFALADRIESQSRSETVGVMLPTGGAFAPTALAAWMLGRTVVPLNYLLRPGELQYVVKHSGVDLVVTAEALLKHIETPPAGARLLKLDQETFDSVPQARWPATAGDGDLAALLYTSGTSGKPKGVMLTHGALSANIRQIREWVDFTPRDTLLGVLPQFHSFGFTVLTLLPLTAGCRVVYSARFVPHRIVNLMREHRPTALIAIPSMYNALLSVKDAGPDDFSSLRFCVSGGEPLPDAAFNRFHERFGVRICEGYGLTETGPVTNWCRPDEFRRGSVGRPLPRVSERIVDVDTGRDLPPGRDGEIRIAGPNVMSGYYRNTSATDEAFDDRAYFRTGDMGRLSADGHLSVTGRIKEMIIVGGENVFPREIEEALNHHESVRDSGVIGVHDGVRGELPVAFVEPEDGAEVDPQSLRAWCRDRLAAYKTPRDVHVVEALPRGPTGKVLRRELRDLLPEPARK